MIPSKKVFALILISVSIVTCAFILAEYKNKTEEITTYTAPTSTSNLVAGTIDTYKDSDGDGLKDWEEALWGTDPKVSDAASINKKESVASKKPENLTATDKLARSFFSQYMNLKEVGLQNDKEAQGRTVQNLVDANMQPASPQQYSASSVKISQQATIRDYGNSVASIIKTNTLAKRSEINILKDALSTENPRFIEELKPSVKGYKDMTQQLLNLNVPLATADIHLRLINAVSSISFIIEAFSKTFVDPMSSIQGLAILQTSFDKLVASFAEITKLLRLNNITYTTDEPGYFFLKTQ
jgi:hypothetical protein